MREGWPRVELAKVGVTVLDCVHKTPKHAADGYPYLAIPNIRDNRIDLSGMRRISEQDFETWTSRYKPLGGDVLVTRRGRVGDTAVIPEELDCAIGQNLVLLRSDGSVVDQRYLAWACRGPDWWNEVERLLNVGAVFDSLNVRDLPRFRLPVPPLEEQRRIVAVLGALDDLIDTDRRLALDIARSQLALFQREWDGETRARLDQVAVITMGQSPPGESYNEHGDGTAFYQGTRDFGWRYPSRRVWTTQPTRIATARDVLVAVRAPVGELNIAAETTALGRGVAGLRAPGRQGTLFQALQADAQLWDMHQGTGTVFAAINKADMSALLVPWVDDNVLEASLARMDAGIADLEQEIVTLTRARDELLPLLLSGRVRVGEVAA